ncbi:unnamed protein product [Phytophthora fragariaefolia]|uniref:Unnamed protein product n=1 Tax=Phytophthora fragariaefolia TaxID=1490495 RepID=A0A9W7DFM5_9STRA|nr:unnamed protein product [Phytophthora fragariaefolia]
MDRNRLTLRRVTTHGRESREDVFVRKAELCNEARKVIAESVLPLNPGVDPCSKVFNMDHTGSVAYTTANTTVEQVGVHLVPALTAGSNSQCITMTVLVRADGVMLPPHFVFKGQPGGEVEREVRSCVPPHVATYSVQENAWFDERVMLKWIEESFRFNATSYSVLLLDALKRHKMDSVSDELGAMGTSVHFVPPGCTGIAQHLDVGVMSPLKTHLRQTCAQAAVLNAMPTDSA